MSAADSPRKRLVTGVQRRHNKPLIEKRRRARINECLSQLQCLVLKATSTEGPRPGKLEKADILEMTVDYIKKISKSPEEVKVTVEDEDVKKQYVAGYEKCVKEVLQFLEKHKDVNKNMRQQISNHCNNKLKEKSKDIDNMEIKCEETDDAFPKSPMLPDTVSSTENMHCPMDIYKPEERQSPQITAHLAAHNEAEMASTPSPTKQATLQQVMGPIKLVCGGDILILLDSSNQSSLTSAGGSKVHTSQPLLAPKSAEGIPSHSFTMAESVNVVPTISAPFPIYGISSLSTNSLPASAGISNFIPTQQSLKQNDVPPGNFVSHPPVVNNNHHGNVPGPPCFSSVWRPW